MTSKSFRQYQLSMVETALFNNALICLPTGLGKTFIAANAILNYYKWFPKGKIFFLAPTRPLVRQQFDSTKCIKRIDQSHVIEITGQCSMKKRVQYYSDESVRIFFMTPQTLQNDLEEKRYDPANLCLLIFGIFHKPKSI